MSNRSLFNYFQKSRLSRLSRKSDVQRQSKYAMPCHDGTSMTDLQKLKAAEETANDNAISMAASSTSASKSVQDQWTWPQIKRKVNSILDSNAWICISVICTIISLFAYDFTIWCLPKEMDLSTDIILLTVFFIFAIELIALISARSNYLWSYWFYLDVLAFISMIPDLTILLEACNVDPSIVNVSNTRASKAGKSARSTALLKMVRMIRFSRLLRVLRAFRFFQATDGNNYDARTGEDVATEANNDELADAGSSKVGQLVSEAVTRKVVLLVLILVMVLPWFEPSGNSFNDAAKAASDLYAYSLINGDGSSITQSDLFSIMSDVGAPILLIEDHVNDVVYREKGSIIDQRRKQMEIWTYTTPNDAVTFKFDIREQVQEEAGLGMLLTLFSICIFTGSTIFVNSSVLELVVEPITRLTQLLMRMAGVIGLMGGAETFESLLAQNNELFVVEALCDRIAMVFGDQRSPGGRINSEGEIEPATTKKKRGRMASVGLGMANMFSNPGSSSNSGPPSRTPKKNGTLKDRLKKDQMNRRKHARQSLRLLKNGKKNLPQAIVTINDDNEAASPRENSASSHSSKNTKALGLMATSRTTHIANDDRVLEVKVTERHRWSFVADKVTKKFREFQKLKNSRTSDLNLDEIEKQMNDAKELQTMENVVDNPVLCYLLRLFMTSNLTLNNLLFILRVRNWKRQMEESFQQLYNTFCDDKSPAQINVSHKLFKEIEITLDGELPINETVFDKAYDETWHLLETNIHRQFKQSDYGMFYCHLKSQDPGTFNSLTASAMALQAEENQM